MKQTSVQLDPHNTEFISALDHVRNTSDNLFLTGKAGSGKTHFLHALMASDAENMVVVAPTGIAAINAGGVTINSFFQIAPSPFLHNDERLCTPEDLRRRGIIRQSDEPHGIFENVRFGDDRLKVIKNLQRLVIDEVSMVR